VSPSWRQQQDEDEDDDRRRRNEDAAGHAALRWAETLFELGLAGRKISIIEVSKKFRKRKQKHKKSQSLIHDPSRSARPP